jgi:hypothetical protein
MELKNWYKNVKKQFIIKNLGKITVIFRLVISSGVSLA